MGQRIDGLMTKGRSDDYRAGHRRTVRACIAWLHREAETMNDPRARMLLNGAAFSLGVDAAAKRRGCTCPTHDRPIFRKNCPFHTR